MIIISNPFQACKPDNNAWYSELAPQVIDGTRCYDDGEILDLCIRGKCHVGTIYYTKIYKRINQDANLYRIFSQLAARII